MENQISWDDINVLRTLSDVPADSEYAREMIWCLWKKDEDTRYLAEKRHKAKQEQDQKEDDYKTCDHEYTVRSDGAITCLTCGLEKRYTSQIPEKGYKYRTFAKNTVPDHFVEIREKMKELMGMVIRETACCELIRPDGTLHWDTVYVEPPEAGLPCELCKVCDEYKLLDGSRIWCQTRSLCVLPCCGKK